MASGTVDGPDGRFTRATRSTQCKLLWRTTRLSNSGESFFPEKKKQAPGSPSKQTGCTLSTKCHQTFLRRSLALFFLLVMVNERDGALVLHFLEQYPIVWCEKSEPTDEAPLLTPRRRIMPHEARRLLYLFVSRGAGSVPLKTRYIRALGSPAFSSSSRYPKVVRLVSSDYIRQRKQSTRRRTLSLDAE